jgi:hypothetical protein
METRYTFDENIVSDLYKEAFGFRPREDFWANWNSYSDDEKQVSWDQMLDIADRVAEAELECQLEAERELNEHFRRVVDIAGGTREDAIRYLHDAYDTNGSNEYLEYILGVRYGYISGSLKVGY